MKDLLTVLCIAIILSAIGIFGWIIVDAIQRFIL